MRCSSCNRPARFATKHGKKANRRVHGDKHHDLCGRCFRDAGNAVAAERRKGQVRPLPPFPPLDALLALVQLGDEPVGKVAA